MNKEDFLAGCAIVNVNSDSSDWNEYYNSEEYFDEIVALMEQECYDGPTGDA